MFPLLLICGPYKSGTSLATLHAERQGYWNPASIGPPERGFGLTMARYDTRECRESRRLSEAVLGYRQSRHGIAHVSDAIRNLDRGLHGERGRRIREYLSSWGRPLVLKDPRFAFTLPLWLGAAARVGRRVRVVFTARDERDLRYAWAAAPLTRHLLNAGELQVMLRYIRAQIVFCQDLRVPFEVHTLAQLGADERASSEETGHERDWAQHHSTR